MASRRLFVMSATAAALAGCSSSGVNVVNPPEPDQFGALLNDAEFASSPVALPPEAITGVAGTLGPRVTLAPLPPVVAQGTPTSLGSPGSCEAQSWGYCLGSYTAARNPDGTTRWNPADPSGAYASSAAWLYSWSLAGPSSASGVCPHGTLATPYLKHLVDTGAPNVAQFPYKPDCAYLGPLATANPSPPQSQLQIGSYAIVKWRGLTKDQFTTRLKNYLAAGNAVAFSGLVTYGYTHPGVPTRGNSLDAKGVWQATGGSGGHGQVIVGYDDALQAFLVQNSFGTQWPFVSTPAPPGMLYWSYDSIWNTQSYFGVAYPANTSGMLSGTPLTPSVSSAPALSATLRTYNDLIEGTQKLVLLIDAAAPIYLDTTQVLTPAGETFTNGYKTSIRTGYTFVSRASGSFARGTYTITLTGSFPNSTLGSFTYTGTVVF